MKKTLYTLLCLALLLSACSLSTLAAGEPAIVVSSAETILGSAETVEVTICLQNNPGIAIFDLTVQYDESILEWTGLETNPAIGGMWLADVGDTLAWVSFGDNFTNDATLCTLTFAVKDTVTASCESVVTVTYDKEAGIANADRIALQIPVQAGKVSITKTCATHTYDGGVVTTQPTCSAMGVKTYTCSTCGDSYTEDIPKLSHESEVRGALEATCVQEGYSGDIICKICDTIIEYGYGIDMKLHAYNDGVVTLEPSCNEPGEMTYTCASCGDSYTKELAALSHEPELRDAQVATCTEEGYSGDMVCNRCDTIIECGHTIDMKSHAFDEGVVTLEPGCDYPGETTYTCTACGDSYTEEIATLPHKSELINKHPATCTEGGYSGDQVCSVCGTFISDGEETSPLGHSPVIDEAVPPTFDNTGLTEGSHCADCGEVLIAQEIVSTLLMGDVDMDSDVDETDAQLALNYVVGTSSLSENGIIAADVNSDSTIDARDATQILRYVYALSSLLNKST